MKPPQVTAFAAAFIHSMPFCVWATFLAASMLHADDWPQFGGPTRDGVWNETGILQTLPAEGLKVSWRAPVGGGLASPVIARGRVFLSDSTVAKPKAWERVHCFDEESGKSLWTHAYEVQYPDWAFDPKIKTGPGSTPLVSDGNVFAIGATGQLLCLDAAKGAVLWQRKLTADYGLEEFSGNTPSPD